MLLIRSIDGSNLLYTQHLALGPNVIKDKSVSPIGASFEGTQFHFSSPEQNIVLKGQVYAEAAQWTPSDRGTHKNSVHQSHPAY